MNTCFDKDKNNQLLLEYKNGNKDVREEIILNNLSLVKLVLNNYFSSKRDEDYYQFGVIGLINAVDTYDFNYNITFSSYATVCIYNEISGRMKPLKVIRLQNKINKYIEEKYKINGTKPSLLEISEYFDIDLELLKEILSKDFKPLSLSMPVYDDEKKTTLCDTVVDQSKNVEKTVIDKVMVETLLGCLTPRNREIVKMYYGIGCIPLNGAEIGKKLNVTRSEISRTILCSQKKMKEYVKVK